jgi:hypothetical protein
VLSGRELDLPFRCFHSLRDLQIRFFRGFLRRSYPELRQLSLWPLRACILLAELPTSGELG